MSVGGRLAERGGVGASATPAGRQQPRRRSLHLRTCTLSRNGLRSLAYQNTRASFMSRSLKFGWREHCRLEFGALGSTHMGLAACINLARHETPTWKTGITMCAWPCGLFESLGETLNKLRQYLPELSGGIHVCGRCASSHVCLFRDVSLPRKILT